MEMKKLKRTNANIQGNMSVIGNEWATLYYTKLGKNGHQKTPHTVG